MEERKSVKSENIVQVTLQNLWIPIYALGFWNDKRRPPDKLPAYSKVQE
jgi:hypothetical protein